MTTGTVVGGAASLGVREVLTAPARPAAVVSAHPHAVHLQVAGGAVIAVVDHRAVRLPNAVVVAAGVPERVHRAVGARRRAGEPAVSVGGGGLRAGDLAVRVGRWWQPRPTLPAGPTAVAALAALSDRLRRLERAVVHLLDPLAGDPGLRTAAGRWERAVSALVASLGAAGADPDGPPAAGPGDRPATAVERAADALLGRGAGLTPTGDDIVAGTLAALVLLLPVTATHADKATAGPTADGTGQVLADAVAARARSRTGAVSAALVAHAARGQVVPSAGRVLEALLADDAAGRGARPEEAVEQLAMVGHTSGAAIARGLVIGARAATHLAVRADTGGRVAVPGVGAAA